MWTGWTWFAVACLVLVLVFALGGLLVVMPWIQERGQQTEVINNIARPEETYVASFALFFVLVLGVSTLLNQTAIR